MNNTNNDILTVSGLNMYVRSKLESDINLRSVYLRGEISNLTDHYRSGHIYLTLKDDKASVKAVMFAGSAKFLKFRPEDGMTVIVRGRVSLYEVTGSYQFYIEDMIPDGAGALNLAFEQLKKKLAAEGLFDQSHKKELPAFPERIGIITSSTGAALQDILRILRRRYPAAEVVLCPASVQGEKAVPELISAVRRFDRLKCADVIIIGRGGGSMEDLWAFNDENLARAIYDCSIPIVSAVGHETDFTICDFVSDVRASTPSAGAELVSPEQDALRYTFALYHRRMTDNMKKRLQYERRRYDSVSGSRVLKNPAEIINARKMKLDMLSDSLRTVYKTILSSQSRRFMTASAKLDALSPLKVLSRGYSAALKNDKIIVSKNDVVSGDKIELILSDGRIGCTVDDILEEK